MKLILSLFCLILLLLSSPVEAQNGIVKSYYADGTVQSEASYVNDVLDGAYITYFPDGKISSEKNYSQGVLDGYVREYYQTGQMKEEYLVKFGLKDGAYRTYYENGQLKELFIYSDGILSSRQDFKTDTVNAVQVAINPPVNKAESVSTVKKEPATAENIILPQADKTAEKKEEIVPSEDDELICDVQVCPVPIGGMKAIQDSLVYPEHALRYGIEGKVKIIATISAGGDVTRTQVLKKLGYGCDEAAQEAIRKITFVPGKNDGMPSETNATITVIFKIFDQK